MAVFIIYLFEMIQIHHDDGHIPVVSLGAGDVVFDQPFKFPSVVAVGHGIKCGGIFKRFDVHVVG